nr:hypothetical protein [Tanacetum cinerariifolium]
SNAPLAAEDETNTPFCGDNRSGLDVVVTWCLRLSHDGVTGWRHDGGSVVEMSGCGV